MRYAFIRAQKARHSIRLMCRVLEVSRAGYYKWLSATLSMRAKRELKLRAHIRTIFDEHRGRYGSPRVWAELRDQGVCVSRKRVERLMRQMKLQARPKRRFVITTQSAHAFERFENVLDRKFNVNKANDVWAADITYLPTRDGWLYLAVVIDLFSRRIIGWAFSDRIDAALTVSALEMALATRPAPRLHHSDQGIQYAASAFQRLLAAHRIKPSMSRRGDCWDNAPVESFFSSMKTELALNTSSTNEQT